MLRAAVFDNADGDGVDFRGADLRDAALAGATLDEANFRGSDLRGANLAGGRFRSADFRGALLGGARFDGADCAGASFDQDPDTGPDDASTSAGTSPGTAFDQAALALLAELAAALPGAFATGGDRVPELLALLRRMGEELDLSADEAPEEWRPWLESLRKLIGGKPMLDNLVATLRSVAETMKPEDLSRWLDGIASHRGGPDNNSDKGTSHTDGR